MEGLAPPLELLITVRSAIEGGESVRTGVLRYVNRGTGDFPTVVGQWILAFDQGGNVEELLRRIPSVYRVSILRILMQGMKGQSIFALLVELEKELIEATQREIDKFIVLLPIKLLIPLLLLQFPAYLILLLGPLLKQLLEGLS